MAPTLFHALMALGLPVVCVESRQAYQAFRSADLLENNIGGKPSFTGLEQMTDMRQSTVARLRDD